MDGLANRLCPAVRACTRPVCGPCELPRNRGAQAHEAQGRCLMTHKRRSEACDTAGRTENCKTVGSAYVGSNPTPATTCGNGPLVAKRAAGAVFLLVTSCISVCHRESARCGVHGRIADGVRAARTVGAHRRLSPDGHGRAALAACFRLDVRRRTGRTSPGPAPAARLLPGRGGAKTVR